MSTQEFMPYLPTFPGTLEYDDEKMNGQTVKIQLESIRHWLKDLQNHGTYTTDIHQAVSGIELALLNLDRFEEYRYKHFGLLDYRTSENLKQVYNGFSKYTKPLNIDLEFVYEDYITNDATGVTAVEVISPYFTTIENQRPSNVVPFFIMALEYVYQQKAIVKEIAGLNGASVTYRFYIKPGYDQYQLQYLVEEYYRIMEEIEGIYSSYDRTTAIVVTDISSIDKDKLKAIEHITVDFGKDREIEASRDLGMLASELQSQGHYIVVPDNKPGIIFVAGLHRDGLDNIKHQLEQKSLEASKLPTLKGNLPK